MTVTNNNKAIINLPKWEVLQQLPAASAVGVTECGDRRGTGNYVYLLISATSFWRYSLRANTYQQLASPPAGTVGAGTAMIFDPSQGAAGRIWAFISNGTATPTFQYYDVATNVWTARSVTNIPATFGGDASMVHTCSTYNGAGNDDYIYLIGNNQTPFYRYSIAGNAWSVMANAVTAAPGAGCYITWLPTYSTDKLVVIRGGATATVYEYNIATPGWATVTIVPATETFTIGTMSTTRWGTGKIVIQKDVTNRVYELDMSTMAVTPLATQYIVATGAAHVADLFFYVKEANGIEYLYYGLHTSAYFLRTGLIF